MRIGQFWRIRWVSFHIKSFRLQRYTPGFPCHLQKPEQSQLKPVLTLGGISWEAGEIQSSKSLKSDQIDDALYIVVDFYSESSSFRGITLSAAKRVEHLRIRWHSHSHQHQLSGRSNLRWLIANVRSDIKLEVANNWEGKGSQERQIETFWGGSILYGKRDELRIVQVPFHKYVSLGILTTFYFKNPLH